MTLPTIRRSDLEKATPYELAAIIKKLQDIDRSNQYRSLERYFETANKNQVEFHKAHQRIRLFAGGNRSGKTTGGTAEDLWNLLGTHPFHKRRVPCKGLLVVQDFESACKKVIEPKWSQWAPPGAIVSSERNQNGAWTRLTMISGSTLDIQSHDQDIKVFEGGDWDWAHFDEPPSQRIFNAVWRGLTDRGGFAYITATPIVGPWMFQLFKKSEMKDPLYWHIFASIDDNAKNLGEGDESLGKQRIKEFLDVLPTDEREARRSGTFLQMQGLILKEFSREHHLIQPFHWPSDWPIWESIDPHPSKPWAVSWMGLTENGKKILLRSGLYQGVLDEIADQILYERTQIKIRYDYKPRFSRCLIDNAASVPSWSRSHTDPTARRRSVREELNDMIGPRAGGPQVEVAPKNVAQKIDLFKRALHITETAAGKDSEFFAFDVPENERFLFEIENYVWDTKRGGLLNGLKDVPKKEDDDILDTIMQVFLTLPRSTASRDSAIRLPKHSTYRV